MKKHYCPTLSEMTTEELTNFSNLQNDISYAIEKLDTWINSLPYPEIMNLSEYAEKKKRTAQWINNCFPQYSGYLFRHVNNAPYDDLIWKNIPKTKKEPKSHRESNPDNLTFYYFHITKYKMASDRYIRREIVAATKLGSHAVGVAICNPEDSYDKTTGRELARNNWKSMPILLSKPTATLSFDAIQSLVVSAIDCTYPSFRN